MVNVIAGKFSFKGCRVAKIKPVVLEDDKEEKIFKGSRVVGGMI